MNQSIANLLLTVLMVMHNPQVPAPLKVQIWQEMQTIMTEVQEQPVPEVNPTSAGTSESAPTETVGAVPAQDDVPVVPTPAGARPSGTAHA